jgi:DNA replicative helicase MCM subunit Mcm2 (Cdc46/Mcm family)
MLHIHIIMSEDLFQTVTQSARLHVTGVFTWNNTDSCRQETMEVFEREINIGKNKQAQKWNDQSLS